MPNELLANLDRKIQSLIEEVELLRLEVNELRQAKSHLEQERSDWETSVKGLLSKFEQIENA
ncbi:cell division protein ZapB [Balneatrix alpica]|uniref:Cell division protein ZapB n=1 Tax=Balneatrix alpica TaxID=75684 RepID=A0ABV5ZCT8_9GAMM|nr:cell division protein ZapB [Balneatrix alpica]